MSMRAVLRFPLLAALAATTAAQTPQFTFTIDREETTLPVVAPSGDTGGPRAGDLVVFKDRLWLRLDEPGDHVWVDRWAKGVVERARTVVAADESSLAMLDDVARRSLRGVRLTSWDDRVAAAVHTLPSDVPLTLTHGTPVDGRMPQLPSGTKYLWLQPGGRPFDLLHAAALRELRALRFDGSRRSPLDLAPFAETRQLQWLELHDVTLRDGGSLLRFTQLRAFVADQVDIDASWLAMAKELRRFEVRDGEVRSLEALAALPNLVEIVIDRRNIGTRRRADGTPSVQLPTNRFPKLRRLELRNLDVRIETARAFHVANPECQIVGVLLPELLNEVLATADRLVIDGRVGLPRFETTDVETVRNGAAMFASLIAWEARPYPRPDAVFEFFTGAERLTRIETYGAFVKVTDGTWLGEFRLDRDAHRALFHWLRSLTPPAAK